MSNWKYKFILRNKDNSIIPAKRIFILFLYSFFIFILLVLFLYFYFLRNWKWYRSSTYDTILDNNDISISAVAFLRKQSLSKRRLRRTEMRCFNTVYPFPRTPGTEPVDGDQRIRRTAAEIVFWFSCKDLCIVHAGTLHLMLLSKNSLAFFELGRRFPEMFFERSG